MSVRGHAFEEPVPHVAADLSAHHVEAQLPQPAEQPAAAVIRLRPSVRACVRAHPDAALRPTKILMRSANLSCMHACVCACVRACICVCMLTESRMRPMDMCTGMCTDMSIHVSRHVPMHMPARWR